MIFCHIPGRWWDRGRWFGRRVESRIYQELWQHGLHCRGRQRLRRWSKVSRNFCFKSINVSLFFSLPKFACKACSIDFLFKPTDSQYKTAWTKSCGKPLVRRLEGPSWRPRRRPLVSLDPQGGRARTITSDNQAMSDKTEHTFMGRQPGKFLVTKQFTVFLFLNSWGV